MSHLSAAVRGLALLAVAATTTNPALTALATFGLLLLVGTYWETHHGRQH